MGYPRKMRTVLFAVITTIMLQSLVAVEVMQVEDALVELASADTEGNPFTQAKASCTAAWTATKTQCLSVKMSAAKGLDSVKKAVAGVGAVIKRVVESSILPPTPAANAANATKAANKTATVEQLGEDDDLEEGGVDQQAHTMAHAACQAMWQEVESLCRQADGSAEQGHDPLVKVIKAAVAAVHKRLEEVIKQHGTPPAPKGNATKPAGNATKPAGNATRL